MLNNKIAEKMEKDANTKKRHRRIKSNHKNDQNKDEGNFNNQKNGIRYWYSLYHIIYYIYH